MQNEIVYPSFKSSAFNCPHCRAYSAQHWYRINYGDWHETLEGWYIAICEHCKNYSIWFGLDDWAMTQIYPPSTMIESPNEDLNENIKKLYIEASEIKDKSPRAAAALLRLALQELCIQLGENGKNINDDISSLVQKGLTPHVQKALDSLRVIGNNAVHPGIIDFDDNIGIVNSLFKMINFIANQTITHQKEIDNLYNYLPEKALNAIKERDKNK